MKENKELFRFFITKKIIYIPLILTAICAYGFYITNYSIGMDDTAVARYYVEGRAPAMGRYTLYLLNFIFRVSNFSPFILEFINVIFLILTAIVWMALIKKIAGEEIKTVLYTVFGCLFISFPLFNEIFVYYYHGSPGMSMAYFFTALSILCVYTFLLDKKISDLIWGIAMFYLALGIYESFTLVYIMACAMVFFLVNLFQKEKFNFRKFIIWIGTFILPIIIGIILRSLTCKIINSFTGMDDVVRTFSGVNWLFEGDWRVNLKLLREEFLIKYVLNAAYYMPLRNYLISALAFLVYSIVQVIRKRNAWLLVGTIGILSSPMLLIPIEGVVTTYRANLGLSLSFAFAALLVGNAIYNKMKHKWVIIVFFVVIIFNQAFNLNHWFYLEDVKYNYQVNLASRLYYDLAKDYDMDREVLVIGDVELPTPLKEQTHIVYDDENYKYITFFEEKLKIEIPEKYFDECGYRYTEVPDLYLFNWGQWAFEDGSVELSHFFEMHGYKLTPGGQGQWYEAKFLTQEGPCYPAEGSITEYNDYIIVKLSDYTY